MFFYSSQKFSIFFYQWHIVILSTCTFCFHYHIVLVHYCFSSYFPLNYLFFRITSLYISRSYLIYISYKQTMNIHRYNASLAKLDNYIEVSKCRRNTKTVNIIIKPRVIVSWRKVNIFKCFYDENKFPKTTMGYTYVHSARVIVLYCHINHWTYLK